MTIPPSILRALHAVRYGDRPQPARDWGIVLGMFVVALLVLLAWSVWFFLVLTSDDASAVSHATDKQLDRHVIDTARATFDARAAEEARYETQYGFVDPSR